MFTRTDIFDAILQLAFGLVDPAPSAPVVVMATHSKWSLL